MACIANRPRRPANAVHGIADFGSKSVSDASVQRAGRLIYHRRHVLVIRPKAFRKETEEVGTKSIYMPPTAYQHLWPYWDMAFKQFSAKGSYLKENTVVRAEFNLYRINDETLLWSGETDTVYSENFETLAKKYANTLVKQLKKDKVI